MTNQTKKRKRKQRKPIVTLLAALGVTLLGIVLLFLEDETVEYLLVLVVSASLLMGGISFMIQGFQIKRYVAGILGLVAYLLTGVVLVLLEYYFGVISLAPCVLIGLVAILVGVVRAAICVNCFQNGFSGGVMNGVFAIILVVTGVSLTFFPVENFAALRYFVSFYMIIYAITIFYCCN